MAHDDVQQHTLYAVVQLLLATWVQVGVPMVTLGVWPVDEVLFGLIDGGHTIAPRQHQVLGGGELTQQPVGHK